MPRAVVVSEATPADLPEVHGMLQEYAAWVGIDLSFQGFAGELAGLPGSYSPPAGGMLLARLDHDVVGMVAFRRHEADIAEMKRLYVRPSARGAGVGHALVEHVIAAARKSGYRTMVLDTLPVMAAAQRLYEDFGFEDVSPYYESPVPGTRYMARALSV